MQDILFLRPNWYVKTHVYRLMLTFISDVGCGGPSSFLIAASQR